ncbi:MAG: tetratricopeptide repeat protein [Verrucomicrobiota bacterium]
MAPCLTHAQDPLRGTLTMGMGDVTAIKKKAEAGDAGAQVALGDALASRFHAIEALDWYRKAAAQGNVEGKYHVGDMLLFGAPGIPNNLTVRPNPAEGIRWTFMAATNFHAHACWNMGKALRHGLGVSTNLVAAYAWLSLFANTTPGSIVGRVQMNELALQLDTAALQEAQNLAAQFKAGNWQAPLTRAIPEGDSRLKLSGITFGAKTPLAVVNGKTLSEGESAAISVKPGTLTIKCLKIEKDSVLITVEGEDAPRLLRLR